jgi:hypothetical protein
MGLFDLFNKEKRKEKREKALLETAKSLFDVTFEEDALWLCYNGQLIAPMSMLTDKNDINECMALVSLMRQLYVKRNL